MSARAFPTPMASRTRTGLIWITYDRDRQGSGDILLARFREEDVAAGKDVPGAARTRQVISQLEKAAPAP